MRTRLSLVAFAVLAFAAFVAAPAASAAKCDPIDPRACLLPWPNDFFTKADKTSKTGLRLNLSDTNLPKNKKGEPTLLADWNGNDGFSPGASIMTQVPGVDLAKSGAVPITNVGAYTKKTTPIVVLDVTGKTPHRWPIWAEVNSRAETAADSSVDVHPAVNWAEGHRYVVVLRNLKTSSGATIKPGKAFKAFLDGKAKGARAKHFVSIFKSLKKAGISKKGVYLSWDFTVASEQNLSSRVLAMRNDAFKQLGDTNLKDGKVTGTAPKFTIDKVTNFTHCTTPGNCSDGQDDELARKVEGTMDVPCYLDQPGCIPGSKMNYKSKKGTNWVPGQKSGNVYKAKFYCNVPWSSLTKPARPSLYGHGLLGDPTEINQGQLQHMSQDHDMLFCATAEIGMAEDDVPNAVKVLQNFSTFATFPDRLQEGMVAGLYLGRLMIHPQGLVSNAAFKNGANQPVIDTTKLFYDGNSQGGIFGGALTAVSPDFTRSVLGVVGMNYSLLVWRSTDFSSYLDAAFKPAYTNALDRELIVNVAQSLWDRGEGDGYAQHMTADPLPGTPAHQVLMDVAVGDHQVSNWAAMVEARTIGASGWKPGGTPFDAGRTSEKVPFWGIPAAKPGFTGSVIVAWDSGPKFSTGSNATQDLKTFGTDIDPLTNTPLVSSDDGGFDNGVYQPGLVGNGRDPHELPRNTPAARQQKSDWLQVGGTFTDQCGGKPCHSVKDY